MSVLSKLKWFLIGFLGRRLLWLSVKLSHVTVVGEEAYKELRSRNKPVIILVWHGRIFLPPYFFRKRGVAALISPSGDGEFMARIISGWRYKIFRGSGSHSIVKAWALMKKELEEGGELIIVPDGPKGPNRTMKSGALKLAQQTGAVLVPFTFSASKKKVLESWDKFLLFYPFGRVVVFLGEPIPVASDLSEEDLEKERQRIEQVLLMLDRKADRYFERP
ncbi:MAG: lysophospholipid acyltransferase family protein [Candidatus Aminicenantes bacterium]|nr:lysophospholipid acyltransferase family protein [Candidatus Aminicenantes bacterium]